MKRSSLFKWMAFTFLLGLASCSNEELQNENRPDVPLKSGEQLVSMKINGLGGTVVTRAAGDNIIALPGEVKIEKLDLYSFVDLDNQSSSAAITGTGADDLKKYTLERIYRYKALGNENDLVLTPVGDGYRVSYGVPKGDGRTRRFVLVVNDGERSSTALTALSLSAAGEGNDRSTASVFSGLDNLKILETALSANGNNITAEKGLPMTAVIGRNEYDGSGAQNFNTLYTNQDVAGGTALNATLVRRVARIDIKNPVGTGFTVKKVTLSGAKNSTMFGNVPQATTSGDYDIVALAAADVVNAELIPAALYALPIAAETANGYIPSVKITGSIGGSGDIEVEAQFGSSMTGTFKGMDVNTRYIVNLNNSAGNVTADITIAEWNYGESVETEDVMGKLNANAQLTAETANATLDAGAKTLTIKYPASSFSAVKIAAIEGTNNSDINPIGIVLPEDCDWLEVGLESAGSLNSSKISYNLKVTEANNTGRPRTAKLSLVTYNTTDRKQKVDEYIVYQDYLDITKYTEEFTGFGPLVANMFLKQGEDVYKCSPFGLDVAFVHGLEEEGTLKAVDVVIPEDCDWIQKSNILLGSQSMHALSMTDNIGKEERRATLTLRRWDASANTGSGAMETKDMTIIQSGTVDKATLCQSAEIQLNAELAAAGYIKMDGNTIIIAGEIPEELVLSGKQNEYMFTISGTPSTDKSEIRPVLVSFGEADNRWVESEGKVNMVTANGSYNVKARFPLNSGNAREMNFTVTTYANGAPVVKTYRLIQKESGITHVN